VNLIYSLGYLIFGSDTVILLTIKTEEMSDNHLDLGRPTHLPNKDDRFKLSVNISKSTARDMRVFLAADDKDSFKNQSHFVEQAIRNYIERPNPAIAGAALDVLEGVLRQAIDSKTFSTIQRAVDIYQKKVRPK